MLKFDLCTNAIVLVIMGAMLFLVRQAIDLTGMTMSVINFPGTHPAHSHLETETAEEMIEAGFRYQAA